ncbi:MAG: zinc-dependent metalloprotease [Pseudomonadota bacterium]
MNKILLIAVFGLLCLNNQAQAEETSISLTQLQQSAIMDEGFVGILADDKSGKTYLKISNIGEQFIYQTSLPSGLGSNDIGLDRGQLGETRLARFERAGNKLFLKQLPTNFRAITENPLEALAIEEAFASSILWGFAIEDSGSDWVLVDASDFVLQDIHGVARRLQSQKQGKGYKVDKTRSAIDREFTKAFVDNTELQATITLVGNEPGNFVEDTAPNPRAITLKMHHSFIRLPDDDYQPRAFHAKSGYWSIQYQDYAQPINQPITQRFIGRHRLEKKDPSAEKSEAVKPIVYYLDPGVPEPVRSALLDGARWWNEAFEALGYIDAYQVKMLPADADPMDVRYNVIQWVHRATRGWSYGFSVADPRTGEIIKGHVTLGSLRVRQDYLIAQALMAPFANGEEDQALMDLALARIRQLSAHEVGHTLGLAHNFAASNYGRASVMDYPHPQFELDGESIVAPNAYGVGLGKWDLAAIAYGYQEFDEAEEAAALNSIITQNDANGLSYISDPDARSAGSSHADASLWDNGANAVDELRDMLEIRAIAMRNFGSANLKAGRNWSDLEEVFVPLYYFHRYQVQAVAKWLGGQRYDYGVKSASQQTPNLATVPAEKQQQALRIMLETLQPEFLQISPETREVMIPKAMGYARSRESVHGATGVGFDEVALAAASAQHTIGLILHPQRLARIQQQSAVDSSIASIGTVVAQLHSQVIDQQHSGMAATLHQAVVDLIYSNYLNLLANGDVAQSVKMQIMAALLAEQKYITRMQGKARPGTAYHGFYNYQANRLANLDTGVKETMISLPKMPPGSPI